MDLTPTPSQTVGPYLHLGLTDKRSVSCVAAADAKGVRMSLTVRLLDGNASPVPDGMIELWQADSEGNYARSADAPETQTFCGFGRMATDENGSCTFDTIKPGRVPGPDGALQAPQINVSILGRGLQKRLATRTYFADEPANATDPILALVPEHRRATLFAQHDPTRSGGWFIEIRLCGKGETVFFDL